MDVSINLWAVLAATATQFIAAGIWYTPIFGKKWGEIHDFDKLDKKNAGTHATTNAATDAGPVCRRGSEYGRVSAFL